MEGVRFLPNCERPLAAKLRVVPEEVSEVHERAWGPLYHHAKFGGGSDFSPFHPPPWWPKTLSFLPTALRAAQCDGI